MISLVSAFTRTGTAQILVESVPDSKVDQYGIVDCGVRTLMTGESVRIHDLVEKPAIGEAPSNFSIVGRYILPPAVMKHLETTARGVGGEIQLTDALLNLLRHKPMHAVMMHGYSFDCGNNLGLLKANIALGLQDAAIEPALVSFLGGLLDDYRCKQAQTAYLGAA
jgi:UTP--glucose-1-phosphate uridylyltransferase